MPAHKLLLSTQTDDTGDEPPEVPELDVLVAEAAPAVLVWKPEKGFDPLPNDGMLKPAGGPC